MVEIVKVGADTHRLDPGAPVFNLHEVQLSVSDAVLPGGCAAGIKQAFDPTGIMNPGKVVPIQEEVRTGS